MTDFGIRIGQFVLRDQAFVCRLPCLAGVVAPECAGSRNGHKDSIRVGPVQDNSVQAHAAGTRLPELALGAPQSCQFLPRCSAVRGLEQRRVLRAGIDRIGVGQ